MPYLPHTEADRREMLSIIGVSSVEELFQDVPTSHRCPELQLPKAVSEMEILDELYAMALKNSSTGCFATFLGAGAYNHFVPSVIPQLASRGEFLTAYTPYQPEVSQGTLQAIFEYQSMIAALTGMDVVNASHYDGATSMAEAAIMAVNVSRGKRRKILVSPCIHPQYRQTLRTYLPGDQVTITGDENLRAGLEDLKEMLDDETACLIIQNPNFLGELMDVEGLANAVHGAGALLVVVANPLISLGLLKPPGDYGADIVVAEGQPLGAGLNFGGPYLGVFAAREEYVRRMPGRLVGETTDTQGRRGYVLTLTPREQHIRREKATSNICTNQGLVALMAGMYLAYMGKSGLRAVAEMCYHKAHYAAAEIDKLDGYRVVNSAPFFNEFRVKCPVPVAELNAALLEESILGGYDLQQDYPHAENEMLICLTEMNTRQQIDRLVTALASVQGV
ncbi:MAG: aminomethyl-transferring glycine dehydrogenase subunit GcvPA [Anaerolineales bacterium]|nr:MAG: aminomethyl-transferring glycine dehydrogenase subunit GcvPA [Anaerolineales bacterium]